MADLITGTLAALTAAQSGAGSPAAAKPRPARHGARWTPADDERLLEMFRGGSRFPDLMRAFDRTRGGIQARLEILGAVPPSGALFRSRPSDAPAAAAAAAETGAPAA